ncbi:MAG: YbaB/EbfC family nucleoid-associated protein [Rickettsiaceae bacterium]
MVNINNLLKQAQSMQGKMQEMQNQMKTKEYSGVSGGNMVKVTVDGGHNTKSINIDLSLLKIEEKEVLEDLLIAAFNDANAKIEKDSQESMSNMMGGMNMPPNFKLPF